MSDVDPPDDSASADKPAVSDRIKACILELESS